MRVTVDIPDDLAAEIADSAGRDVSTIVVEIVREAAAQAQEQSMREQQRSRMRSEQERARADAAERITVEQV